jgi:CheY-specific phosphatase CheX
VRLHPENGTVLDETLCVATRTLFACYGVVLESAGRCLPTHLADHDAAGVIGFVGSSVRGTLVVATSMPLLAKSCPTGGDEGAVGEARMRDWIAEIANLVLGRVKLVFSSSGVDFGLATPVGLTGTQIRLAAVRPARTRAWDLACSDGAVRVWIEADFEPGVVLQASSVSAADAEAVTGEPLFF